MTSGVGRVGGQGGAEVPAEGKGPGADDADEGVAGQGVGDRGQGPVARFRQPGSAAMAFMNTLAATEARFSVRARRDLRRLRADG